MLKTSLLAAGLTCCFVAAHAQPSQPVPGKSAKPAHEHKPIEIPGDPIVERLRVKLERPRRVLIDPAGHRYLVDSGAGKVFKLDPAGKLSTIAANLNEPSGIARDRTGVLFISNHANGEEKAGSIVRISADGKQTVFAAKLTGPKGLAIDAQGNLYAAMFEENRILKFGAAGKPTEFAANVVSPAGLVFDRKQQLLVANTIAGTVSRISPKGKVHIAARGLSAPSDVTIGPDGDPVATNYTGTHLSRIAADGKAKPLMNVPRGTIGVAFDAGGNLTFTNWDLQGAVKVTTRLSIPCPHCNKKIPVRIRPKVKPKKKSKPVI